MFIKNLSEIENEIIYEQIDFKNKTFLNFLTDFKRSEKYTDTVLAFLFFFSILNLSSFTLSIKNFDWVMLVCINIFILIIFVLAQYGEWIKCYLIKNNNIWFGIAILNKCIFFIKKNHIDLIKFQISKEFSQYVFVFNGGFVKYTLSFSKKHQRINEVELIIGKNSILLEEFSTIKKSIFEVI